MKLSAALSRTPFQDKDGNVTVGWVRFFGDICAAVTGLLGIAAPVVTLTTSQVLTADATIFQAAPQDGQIWIARVDQDATGGWVVTWGSNVSGGPVVDVTPSTMSIQTFFGSGGKWIPAGAPVLGIAAP